MRLAYVDHCADLLSRLNPTKRGPSSSTRCGEAISITPKNPRCAKRCEHHGYGPAKVVCSYLITNGATEFSDNNAKAAVECLSTKTQFAPLTQLNTLSISFQYGTETRGALVDVNYSQDKELGGMVLSVVAQGY